MLSSLFRVLRGASPEESRAAADDRDGVEHRRIELALLKYENGEAEAAESLAGEYLKKDPDHATALSILAAVSADRGEFPRACEIYEKIVRLKSSDPEWLFMAAEMNRRGGTLDRALELSQRAIDLDPASVNAWVVRANTLEEMARPREAQVALARAVSLDASNAGLHSKLLFMLTQNGLLTPEETLAEHRRWAARHADSLAAASAVHSNDPDPERRLRIGYISADLRNHAVANFIEPVLAAHDRIDFEIICYSNCVRPDKRTERLRLLADRWRDISRMNDSEAEARIREDSVDILVDLSGHTLRNRLLVMARKPAPVQVSWLGYIGTTGMKAIDYCISDALADPPGLSETHYSEKLLRLPVTQWCYLPPENSPPVTRLPALERSYITLGSFSGFPRLGTEIFRVWARILRAVPTAQLRLTRLPAGDALDSMFEEFESSGVSADRLELVGWVPYESYLAQYQEVDIALGPYPYAGTTTVCDALWMGLPVVSRVGESRQARSAASLLTAVGMTDLLALDWDAYVEVAVRLASDLAGLAVLRAGLRERMRRSPLVDANAFARALEDRYRAIWRNWCRSRGRERGS